MEHNLRSVGDLPAIAREALAAATGLPLESQKQFYIVVLNVTEGERRDRAWAEMQRIAATAQRNVEASGIAPQPFDALIDDVSRETRYGRGT
jgi:hypothetical protein